MFLVCIQIAALYLFLKGARVCACVCACVYLFFFFLYFLYFVCVEYNCVE